MVWAGSSSESLCAAAAARTPRATATSRAAGTAPVGAVRVPARRGGSRREGFLPERASCVVVVTRECLAREGPSHGVRGVARGRRARELLEERVRVFGFEPGDDLQRPRANVFSQRQPDARDDLGQPRHLALLVLDLPRVALHGVEQTAREPGVSGHLGHDVVEEPERRFLQEVLRELRRWTGSGLGRGQRSRRSKARIFEKATRDGSRSAVGRGRALAFGLRTIGSEPCRSSCVTVQYSAMAPTTSPRTRPGAFELCAPPSRKRLSFSGAERLHSNAGEFIVTSHRTKSHGYIS